MFPTQKPASIQVFGILNLVFAALSLGSAMISLVRSFSSSLTGGSVLAGNAQFEAMQNQPVVEMISGCVSLAVGALLLVAGIQLLQSRRSALLWSNRYAWASIGSKILSIGLSLTFIAPVMGTALRGSGPNEQAIQYVVILGIVGGSMISMIYPVACLLVLNRPLTKEWLALHGRPS